MAETDEKKEVRRPTMGPVYDYLKSHPDTEFSVEAISSVVGTRRSSTSWALRNLTTQGAIKESKVRGFFYYTKNGSESSSSIKPGDLLEVVRVRVDGDLVIIDTNGDLYVARKVDI